MRDQGGNHMYAFNNIQISTMTAAFSETLKFCDNCKKPISSEEAVGYVREELGEDDPEEQFFLCKNCADIKGVAYGSLA